MRSSCPTGFGSSPDTTPRDWTEETLAQIREFYREFTDSSGGDKVNLQGIVFDTNQGGRLPLEKYLAATIAEREPLTNGRKSIETVARERGLNAKYLGTLWKSLTGPETVAPPRRPASPLADRRSRKMSPTLVAGVAAWQKGLWRFSTVGHIGKVGGPKAWHGAGQLRWSRGRRCGSRSRPRPTARTSRFRSSPPMRGTATIMISSSGNDRGSSHRAGPTCSCGTFAESSATLTARRERLFASSAKFLRAAEEAECGARPGRYRGTGPQARRGRR